MAKRDQEKTERHDGFYSTKSSGLHLVDLGSPDLQVADPWVA